ncbi:MAG: chaperone modulator CbpM [Steroidobacteraceae bacterium]
MTPQQSTELTGHIVEEGELTLDEFCSICAIEEHHVVEMLEHGIIETRSVTQWRFSGESMRRARISLRLQRDLGVNPAGTAVVLDLLEQIDSLQRRLRQE